MVQRIAQLVAHRAFHHAVLGLIVLGAVLVGLETSYTIMDRFGDLIYTLDAIVVYLFAIEAILKMAAHGRHWYRYFADPWNVFDFTIVVVCLLPIGGHYAAVLRLARVLRALRLVSAVPKLQLLVGSLMKSLPSMAYVGMLLALLFYIYAVMGVFLFRDNDPVHFRDLGVSLLALFRVITLEDWTDIMYIQIKGSEGYSFTQAEQAIIAAYAHYQPQARPMASVLYFISFVLIGTMVMLNLVIGVIINSMDEATAEAATEAIEAGQGEGAEQDQVDAIAKRLREAQAMLEQLRNEPLKR
jgi:voltage-gated sodium channel